MLIYPESRLFPYQCCASTVLSSERRNQRMCALVPKPNLKPEPKPKSKSEPKPRPQPSPRPNLFGPTTNAKVRPMTCGRPLDAHLLLRIQVF